MNDINRYALENNHFFETKKKIVLTGESCIFNNWKEHSTITREEFLEAIEWVCSDPLKEDGRMTREIGLTPTGIIKLHRCYGLDGICTFYCDWKFQNGKSYRKLWNGEFFERPCKNEKERLYSLNGKTVREHHKICLSCRDRV